MEDNRLNGKDASGPRFGSRADSRAHQLDQPPQPRKSFIRRLCIAVAVVVGVSFVLAILFVIAAVVYIRQVWHGADDWGTPAERTAGAATYTAQRPALNTMYAATEIAVVIGATGNDRPIGTAADYFEGNVDPCIAETSASDPCAVGRQVEFMGSASRSRELPSQPPSLEAMLFNSWDGGDLADVPEHALLSTTHIIARGRFVDDSLNCDGYPVVNPEWSLAEGQRVISDHGIEHWMCFAEFTVQEYLVGFGAGRLNVNIAAAAVAYQSGTDFEANQGQSNLDQYRASVTSHFFGSDWVVWLGPSYTMAVESWTAYSLWDVQKGDDGVVRVISPVADYYAHTGLTGSTIERLKTPLSDFRRDIKAAHASRVRRTSARIGVGRDMPRLVTDAFKLRDYYIGVGAYRYAIATPAPPPTSPNPPTGLYAERRANPRPKINLDWTAPVSSQVSHYKMLRVDSLGNETIIAAALPGEFTETTDRDLPTAGMRYTYTVIAVNAYGESAPSGGATVRNGRPNPPTELYVSLQHGNEAVLEWKAPASSYVTGYRVERKRGNHAWVTIQDNIPARGSGDDRLAVGTRHDYAYRVIALNGWSESAPSEPYTLHVP